MNYALNYMYSELVFHLDGNNINIDVRIIQWFGFGYHTNKISIQTPELNVVLSISCQFTIITEKNCSVYEILELRLQCISDC